MARRIMYTQKNDKEDKHPNPEIPPKKKPFPVTIIG